MQLITQHLKPKAPAPFEINASAAAIVAYREWQRDTLFKVYYPSKQLREKFQDVHKNH